MTKNYSGKNRSQNKNVLAGQKNAEDALRQSENQMRLITDAMPALIAYVDREHRYRFVNRKYFEWFGQEPSEIIGKHLLEVIGKKAYSLLLPQIERVFRGEKFTYEQLVNYRFIGNRYVQIDFLPDFDLDGKTVKGYYALIQDIDERKRRESNLQLLADIAEDFARLLIAEEIMSAVGEKVGKYLNVASCLFVEINESADLANVRSTWSSDSNLPQTIGVHKLSEFISEEFQSAARRGETIAIVNTQDDERTNAESFASFNIYSIVTVPFRRAGEWKYLFAVYDTKPREWSKDELELIREVSSRTFPRIERAFAEAALRESEERFRLATNAAEMFSWETNIATQTVRWSENAAEIIGCAPEDLPEHFDDGQFFVLKEDKEILDRKFRQILNDGITYYFSEFRGNEPEPQRKFWQAQGLIIYDEDKNPVRVVGVTQNITARKLAEQERERLLESEKMARLEAEQANSLKDEFLATVSHELRTPLNAILGWSTIARNNPSDVETTARALEIIERSARQQNQIIADILDVSRIITGKLHLNIMPVNLCEAINSAIETVRPMLDAKRIKLETNYDLNATLISGDTNRLQQIMWNLLTNAVKFSETDGLISVSLRGNGAFAEVTVTDQGIGIDPEFLPFVFDRFRQADGGMNRKHGGLGLGLSIVRHLTEAHGGSVGVESLGKGKGSSFLVRFPLQMFERKTPEKEFSPEFSLTETTKQYEPLINGIRILLVDDDPDALALAATILRANGAIVITADSADNALRKLQHNIPDIIISDIGMPGKSGNELMQEIRKTYGNKIPAIALTAYARPEDRRQILEAGFDVHFPKPVEGNLLVSTIKNFFQ